MDDADDSDTIACLPLRDLSVGSTEISCRINEVKRKKEARDIFPEKTDKNNES